MEILIDGYNLLHASDIFGEPPANDASHQTALERSREALLAFLAESLGARLAASTTIVFDAADAPPGLPHTYHRYAMLVRFAKRYDSADQLIGELIEQHTAPKELLVVSSDHAVQRMARQCGASYCDSESWFAQLRQELQLRREAAQPTHDPTGTLRQGNLSAEEVQHWLDEFGA